MHKFKTLPFRRTQTHDRRDARRSPPCAAHFRTERQCVACRRKQPGSHDRTPVSEHRQNRWRVYRTLDSTRSSALHSNGTEWPSPSPSRARIRQFSRGCWSTRYRMVCSGCGRDYSANRYILTWRPWRQILVLRNTVFTSPD